MMNQVVMMLNRVGTTSWGDGRDQEALQFFRTAESILKDEDSSSDLAIPEGCTDESLAPLLLEDDMYYGMSVCQEALDISDSLFFESPSVLRATISYNIAQVYARKKEFQATKLYLERAVKDLKKEQEAPWQRLLRQSSPLLSLALQIQHNLGYCCYRMGHLEDALIHYSYPLEDEEIFKAIHQLDRAISLNCTAMIHARMGNSVQAVELLSHAISLASSTGEKTRTIALFLKNLSTVCSTHLSQDLPSRTLLSKKETPSECPLNGAGGRLQRSGEPFDHQEAGSDSAQSSSSSPAPGGGIAALHALEGALQSVYLSVQGEGFLGASDLVSALQSCGDMCTYLNQPKKAVQFYKDAICVDQGQSTEVTSAALLLRMKLLQAQSDMLKLDLNYPMAMASLKQLYDLQCDFHGPSSQPVASTVSSMGWIQYLLGSHSSALHFYEEALRIWLANEGPRPNDIKSALNMTGLLFLQLKKYEKARNAFLKCLSLVEGKSDVRAIATLQYNLAVVELARGRDEHGLAMLELSLESDRKALGRFHPDLMKTLFALGELHQGLGHFEQSLDFYQEALNIGKVVLVRASPDEASCATPVLLQTLQRVCKLLNLMGNVRLATGNIPAMMQHLVEATRLVELMRCSSQLPFTEIPSIEVSGHLWYTIHRLFPPCARAA